ncbi:hypothetical protein KGR20_21490 [Cytobacillus oceanisediminis]|uniref:hypothetical protein n=1 Tax=Cytobacillus oceanisediminis TaxID=665099 RepID=UPI001CCBBE98|nr:hypothetical protein [Cytobacillus oceanisediminis]MBZ9536737.1 hypothetical protein [Cytobacillus oceanisediminis]
MTFVCEKYVKEGMNVLRIKEYQCRCSYCHSVAEIKIFYSIPHLKPHFTIEK